MLPEKLISKKTNKSTVHVDNSIHKKVKVQAAIQSITIEQWVDVAIREKLNRDAMEK